MAKSSDAASQTPTPMSPGEHLERVERIDALIRERRAAARVFPTQRVLELQAQLSKGSRDMFIEHLANALDGQASLSEIRALSSEDPLKGAQVLQIYSKLAGVAERSEVSIDPNKIPMSEAIALLREFGFTVPEKLFPHEIDAAVEPALRPSRSPTSEGADSVAELAGGLPTGAAHEPGSAPSQRTSGGSRGIAELPPGSRSEALLPADTNIEDGAAMAASSLRDAEGGLGSERSAAELHSSPEPSERSEAKLPGGLPSSERVTTMAASSASLRSEPNNDV